MQYIDWDAHGKAIRRLFHLRAHLTKLIHDILPTNDNVSQPMENQPYRKMPIMPSSQRRPKPHPTLPPHCSRCLAPKVSYISPYILRQTSYPAPSPNDSNLSDGDAWLHDTPPDFSTYPSVYSNLIYQQTQIGWRQLFNGCNSTKWSRLQDDYLLRQGLHNKKTTGQLWATNIISCVWEEWHLVWMIRNEVIHGHDQTSRNCIQRTEAELEI
jgi:hypothetical protein